MSTEPAPNPAPSGDPAPNPNPAPNPAPNSAPNPEPKPGDAPQFKIPDAYKDKPWAAKIKSEDDVYKQIDTLTELKGKKAIVPDFTTAKPEEVESYFNSLRPADKSAYKFGEYFDETVQADVAGMLHEAGIAEAQAAKLLPLYEKFEQKRLTEATSEEGFNKEMVKSFGEKFDGKVTAISQEHKQHLSAEDQAVLDKMPNEYYGIVARLTAKMLEAYGAGEKLGAHDGKSGTPAGEDIVKTRADLREQIQKISDRPHTYEEKQKLIDALNKTYERN